MSTLHTVRTEETTVAVDVDCAYCGFAGTATVRSRGMGTATSHIGLDRARARRAAAEEALEDVAHQARVTASLLPCRRCHRRSRVAIAQYVIATALGALALVAFAVIAWWVSEPGFWRWFGPGALLFGAGALVVSKRTRFRRSEALLEGVRVRVILPQAAAVKIGPAVVPIASKAPDPQPIDDDPGREPKLLG